MNGLIARLNKIAELEFKANYNKSEFQRVTAQLPEVDKIRKEVTEGLNKLSKDGSEYHVSQCGYVTRRLLIKVEGNCKSYKEFGIVYKPTFKTPYAYAMGSKISKKNMEHCLKQNGK